MQAPTCRAGISAGRDQPDNEEGIIRIADNTMNAGREDVEVGIRRSRTKTTHERTDEARPYVEGAAGSVGTRVSSTQRQLSLHGGEVSEFRKTDRQTVAMSK